MTATDLNRPEMEAPPEPGSIGAGAEIYRRMERRGRGRPMWMTAAPIVAVALVAAGGVVAYQAMKPHAAPAPAVAKQTLPPVALAPIAPATTPKPAQVASVTPATPVTPAPAEPARPVTPERVRTVAPIHARPAVTRSRTG